MSTIETQIEEVKGLVVGIRSEFEAKSKLLGEKTADSDTAIVRMEAKFSSLSEQIQKQQTELKAAQDTANELALSIARNTKQVLGAESEMSEDVKSMFYTACREVKGTYALDRNVMEKIVAEHVAEKFSHMPLDKQQVCVKSILAEGSSPAGGMWCPVPVSNRITKRVWETSPIRQIANVMSVNTQAMKFALDDEDLTVTQRGEINAVVETGTPEFGEVRIDVHEIYAKPKATLQVLEDSTFPLENWLAGKVADKFARTQNYDFVRGTGIKSAKGILTYADADAEAYERNKLGTISSEGNIVFTGDDFINLQSSLQEQYQSNAKFLMHRLIWAKVAKLKATDNQYLLRPEMLFSGAPLQLLGAPVVLAGDMPKPTSNALVAGTIYAAYGDFREGYTILDRLGVNIIMDNITESGFVKWYFRTRVGGGVTNFQAIKRLKAVAR